MWAAYNMGGLRTWFPDGLEESQSEFTGSVLTLLDSYYKVGGISYIAEGFNEGKKAAVPIAFVAVDFFQSAAWPHVEWFSWATPRNKIEATVTFLQELKRDTPIMIISKPETVPFFSHMGRYGLLQRKATLKGFMPDGDGILYYGRMKR